MITDELREWFKDRLFMGNGYAELTAIADRIEAEAQDNERFRREAEPFCNRLREAAAGREDVTLFGVDYTAFPVDIDGEPWHVGDEIANEHNYHLTVSEIIYKGNGCWMLRAEPKWIFYADIARHHRPPTVEGILREFALRAIRESEGNYGDLDETCAEYAKRLRLAGEDE